jgi:anti-sigma factor RsiW
MTPPSEDLLSAYLDDEVTADERALVEQRLGESEEWRAVLDEVRSTRDLLRRLPVRDAPDGFWDELLSDDPAPVSDLDARRRRRNRVVSWIAGAAAAAAIAAVIFVPGETRVKPPVGTLVAAHAARSSVSEEPLSQLAPVATPMRFRK